MLTGNRHMSLPIPLKMRSFFLSDHDELYWNVTGNYWKADIREASATVV